MNKAYIFLPFFKIKILAVIKLLYLVISKIIRFMGKIVEWALLMRKLWTNLFYPTPETIEIEEADFYLSVIFSLPLDLKIFQSALSFFYIHLLTPFIIFLKTFPQKLIIHLFGPDKLLLTQVKTGVLMYLHQIISHLMH